MSKNINDKIILRNGHILDNRIVLPPILLKKNENKVILQINHGGIKVKSDEIFGPSSISQNIKELTDIQINQIIKDFGKATKRAFLSGFDGVEIHGANHYLLQHFMSKNTNRRTDNWGGSLSRRMIFPLEVVKEVKNTISNLNLDKFILGYRISPEEIHGEIPGYLYQSSLQLIKEISKYDLDYIHLSLNEYNQTPYNKGEQKSYAELFKNVLDDNTKLIISGNINNKKSLHSALIHSDLIALGRQSLIDPLFTKKILENREDEIIREISPSQLINTKWPKSYIEMFTNPNINLGKIENIESIKHLRTGEFD